MPWFECMQGGQLLDFISCLSHLLVLDACLRPNPWFGCIFGGQVSFLFGWMPGVNYFIWGSPEPIPWFACIPGASSLIFLHSLEQLPDFYACLGANPLFWCLPGTNSLILMHAWLWSIPWFECVRQLSFNTIFFLLGVHLRNEFLVDARGRRHSTHLSARHCQRMG